MKFSGKMYPKIILKVTENQGFTLSLELTFFEKPQGGSDWLPPAVLGLTLSFYWKGTYIGKKVETSKQDSA